MKVEYDKYYQAENLFGDPYPELVRFYAAIEPKGTLLDLGCGQGRDAIALARLGYDVMGIDYSKVGIEQLNAIAEKEGLSLKGKVADIYAYTAFDKFDFMLLDSMFHFGKKEREKEIAFLRRLFANARPNTLVTICIQDGGKKVETLHTVIAEGDALVVVDQTELIYTFEDKTSNHRSETAYKMITIKKGA